MPDSIFTQEILSRAGSAFMGLAIGDSLGAPVEFMTPHEIKAQYGTLKEIVGGGWLRIKPGQVTDDTQMSLCIARAIVAAHGWSLKGIADNFATWMKSRPIDVGDTCRKGIRNYMLKGELEVPYNQWGAGNGAVMRMLPVALFTLGDDPQLAACAVEQAHITHNNAVSDAACIFYGRLVHLALAGHSKTRLRRELEGLFSRFENFRFEPYRGLATGYVVDTLQTVFHYFFKSRNFEECLTGVVNQGGDADTTGAIAGMLAGAYYGMGEIPKRWLKKMDRAVLDEAGALARQLVMMSPMVRQGSAGSCLLTDGIDMADNVGV
ncbi:MAG TPA: ADP-ribosyl-[dinitrogen reductase] hydrolase [Geobacteraceae bacterium]|nr:ADP-ribosyl-[dinitrogen reductase] hydrolase [Geobacteraceae bacterium]